MTKALETNLPAKLARGQRRFERWRSTHRPHSRLPKPLWSLAVQLARKYGVGKTARMANALHQRQQNAEQGTSGVFFCPGACDCYVFNKL